MIPFPSKIMPGQGVWWPIVQMPRANEGLNDFIRKLIGFIRLDRFPVYHRVDDQDVDQDLPLFYQILWIVQSSAPSEGKEKVDWGNDPEFLLLPKWCFDLLADFINRVFCSIK